MTTRFQQLPTWNKIKLIGYEFNCLIRAVIADWTGDTATHENLCKNAECRREYWLAEVNPVEIIFIDNEWMIQNALPDLKEEKGTENEEQS